MGLATMSTTDRANHLVNCGSTDDMRCALLHHANDITPEVARQALELERAGRNRATAITYLSRALRVAEQKWDAANVNYGSPTQLPNSKAPRKQAIESATRVRQIKAAKAPNPPPNPHYVTGDGEVALTMRPGAMDYARHPSIINGVTVRHMGLLCIGRHPGVPRP